MKTITEDIITQIRATYLGSDFVMILNSGEYKTSKLTIGMLTLFNRQDFLSLKNLVNLEDNDALEVFNIIGVGTHLSNESKIFQCKELFSTNKFYNQQTNISASSYLKAFQYLQSKGYALPYLEYSIEDLIELGVYKLK